MELVGLAHSNRVVWRSQTGQRSSRPGIVELFRLAKCEQDLDREILAFSISHDHRAVRIYGYYAEIYGDEKKYYRHSIRKFSFPELDVKEK